MLWPPAQTEVYNVALAIKIFPFSGPWSEKVGHPCLCGLLGRSISKCVKYLNLAEF